ncbi:MAG: anti-sigma factor [Rubrivivax sp.]
MDYGRRELADALAAEYVAGTLRGPARRRFEALLPGHPALRAAVQDWQARLMPLAAEVAPQPPPARVWRALEQRLWPKAAAAAPLPWWRRLAPWRALSGLATAAALALAVLLASPPPARAPIVVVLQSTGAEGSFATPFVASLSADGGALVTQPVQPVALTADRVLELWSVPPQGAPTSLGLIKANGTTVVAPAKLPPALLKGGTAALAVSVEPPGGSPTGAPTGPVVYAGKLQI